MVAVHRVRYSNRRLLCPKKHRPDDQRKKVAIIGPRDMPTANWLWFCKTMDRLTFALDDPIVLALGSITEKTNHTARMAMNWASWNWYTAHVFYPDESKHKPAAAVMARDDEFINAADFLVAFVTDARIHTSLLIDMARGSNKKVKLVEV